jgi:biopolymer transport protein ExbB
MHELFRVLLAPIESYQTLVGQGGVFVFWIFLCGVLLWTLSLERAWYFNKRLPKQVEQALASWRARAERKSWCALQVRRRMISQLTADMTRNFPLLRVLVPLSPLLGLIGTVAGMLEVFDSMSLHGSADATAMASGVSQAMVCTLTGLAVSISGLYPAHHFRNRAMREAEHLANLFEF